MSTQTEKTFYFFVGTTAEFIKIAPVIKEFKRRNVRYKIITTGQTQINFREFYDYLGNVKPDIELISEIKKQSSVPLFMFWSVKTFVRGLVVLTGEFKRERNALLIIHGDTVSALLGAIIGKLLRIKIAHIESGLRSFDFIEPFPEEICRYIVSKLVDIHFCPNKWSMENIKDDRCLKINTKQNTLIEAHSWAIKSKGNMNNIKKNQGKYYVLVLHRQEHVIFGRDKAKRLFNCVLENSNKNLKCVFIKHQLAADFLNSVGVNSGGGIKNKIILVPRLPYAQFNKLIDNAEYIATDGGSNQEEAYYMGKPCLILRNVTERMEGLGINAVLAKSDTEIIKNFLANYHKYERNRITTKYYPSKIITENLLKYDY